MLETTTNPQVRDGIAKAHAERGLAIRHALAWLFGRRK